MAGVRVKDNEPIESAIRRFKKQCEKAGILQELKKREHYEKPSVRRKRKAIAARKRALRRASRRIISDSPRARSMEEPTPTLLRWVFSFGDEGQDAPRPLRKAEGPGMGAKVAVAAGFVSTGSTN